MRLARRGVAFAALAGALLVAGCSSDNNTPNAVPIDLTGTYTLQTFEQGAGSALVEVTGATGTFNITSSSEYTAVLNIPGVGPIADAGTYTANGTTSNGVSSGDFTQTSTTNGSQATGTFTFTASTGVLVLSTSVQGLNQRITLVKD
jgi:hypothetical protein